jgi:hypothetical protein
MKTTKQEITDMKRAWKKHGLSPEHPAHEWSVVEAFFAFHLTYPDATLGENMLLIEMKRAVHLNAADKLRDRIVRLIDA